MVRTGTAPGPLWVPRTSIFLIAHFLPLNSFLTVMLWWVLCWIGCCALQLSGFSSHTVLFSLVLCPMTCLDLPGFPTPSLQLRESTGLYFNCISLCHSLEALKAASRLVCHPPLKATVLYYLMSRILKTIVPCCVFSVCLEWRVSLAPFISSWSGVLISFSLYRFRDEKFVFYTYQRSWR